MKNITQQELRGLIQEEAIKEGMLDSVENLATAGLSHLGVGDAAALLKALTLDSARAVSSMTALDRSLKVADFKLADVASAGKEKVEEAVLKISELPAIAKKDVKEGIVVQEIQAGYTMYDRLLRPAMVAVSKNPGAEGSGDEEQTEGNQVENDEKTKETLKNN